MRKYSERTINEWINVAAVLVNSMNMFENQTDI